MKYKKEKIIQQKNNDWERVGKNAIQLKDNRQNIESKSINNSTIQRMPSLGVIGSGLYSAGAYLGSAIMAHPYITAAIGIGALGYWYKNKDILKTPQKGQNSLENMKESEKWRMYINPKDHKIASQKNQEDGDMDSPGDFYKYYDEQNQKKGRPSEGFGGSMIEAINQELLFKGGHLGRKVDYKEYERLHNLVTEGLKYNGISNATRRDTIRTRSSADPTVATAFPINDWSEDLGGLPAEDLMDETIDGMPMVRIFKQGMKIRNSDNDKENKSVLLYDGYDEEFNEQGEDKFRVRYTEEEGVNIVKSILNRYYNEIGKANTIRIKKERENEKLKAIVKVIRALHVTHPFRDANGRLHIQLMLNKFLLEQGFSPTILGDKGLGVFGGAFSVDELKEEVIAGMDKFDQYTLKESKKEK
ncbi:hypothetical protein [Bizionia paragorgiae]|uniref:hypothetical protein n=1 Tax=Bizionia paragorgiae TaxID=283786 RepID=UPI003A8DC786